MSRDIKKITLLAISAISITFGVTEIKIFGGFTGSVPESMRVRPPVEVIVCRLGEEVFHKTVPGDVLIGGLKYQIGEAKGVHGSKVTLFKQGSTEPLDYYTGLSSLCSGPERKLYLNAVINTPDDAQ